VLGCRRRLRQIITLLQLDRLDPPRPRLVCQMVADSLPAAGLRVPYDDRAPRRLGLRERHAHREDTPGETQTYEDESDRNEPDAEPLSGQHYDDGCDQEEREARQQDVPHVPAPLHCVPCSHGTDGQQHHHHKTAGEVTNDLDDGDHHTGEEKQQS
jgi:hypothetical protein